MILIWLFVVVTLLQFLFFVCVVFLFSRMGERERWSAHAPNSHTLLTLETQRLYTCLFVWPIWKPNVNWTCYSIACALYECLIFAHWNFYVSPFSWAHWNKNHIFFSSLLFFLLTFSFDTNELRPSAWYTSTHMHAQAHLPLLNGFKLTGVAT